MQAQVATGSRQQRSAHQRRFPLATHLRYGTNTNTYACRQVAAKSRQRVAAHQQRFPLLSTHVHLIDMATLIYKYKCECKSKYKCTNTCGQVATGNRARVAQQRRFPLLVTPNHLLYGTLYLPYPPTTRA